MSRTTIVLAVLCLALIATQARSQASKQLDERAKKVATPPEQSWKQVDDINKESDKTRDRYQTSKRTSEQAAVRHAYSSKKAKPSTGSAYKKPSPSKKKPPAKK